MIISCPSCRTRYRHHESSERVAGQARCSRCDEVFDVENAGRSYRVKSAASADGFAAAGLPGPPGATGRLSIGMDDPSLASRLERTGLDTGAAAMTYRVQISDHGTPALAAGRSRRGWLRGAGLAALGSMLGWVAAAGLELNPWAFAAIGALLGLLVWRVGVPWSRKSS